MSETEEVQTQNHGGANANARQARRFRDVSPSEAAEAELHWFFNEAESAIEEPSNFTALLSDLGPSSLEAVERRAEARHAAEKIHAWLRRLRPTDAWVLSGIYTERLWSEAVVAALPDGTAGAASVSVTVRAEHLRALARCQTSARTVTEWIEEVVRRGRPDLVAEWRQELESVCAMAVGAYERVRGNGPSLVPETEVG
ncbi:MAG TPA: hypothetical protein VIJ22_02195 [Polyangiaceae bacterium]